MSSKIIKRFTEAFNKKEDCEATNMRLSYPYFWDDEPQDTVNTQPRQKSMHLAEEPLMLELPKSLSCI
jgi:hypothetical protein